jgi:branched-chain amino acid transport system ATP-binding protein
MSLLSVENLRTNYGRVEALRGIDLTVEEGEILTIIGANGAGKSTTLRTISGLVFPVSGCIFFLQRRIDGLRAYTIVSLGISHVPEGRRIFPRMTVLENLKMGAFLRRDGKEREENLSKVCLHFPVLKMRLSQLGGTLSGGEQQMLAIGRALMSNPRLLLLDEPSLGLAPLVVIEIARIIQEINQRGVTLILVEQKANLALRLADRGYVLETGKIVLHGKASDLVTNEHVKKAYLGE